MVWSCIGASDTRSGVAAFSDNWRSDIWGSEGLGYEKRDPGGPVEGLLQDLLRLTWPLYKVSREGSNDLVSLVEHHVEVVDRNVGCLLGILPGDGINQLLVLDEN